MAKFWSSIKVENGIATVVVNDNHLLDFPAFMNEILVNEIGFL